MKWNSGTLSISLAYYRKACVIHSVIHLFRWKGEMFTPQHLYSYDENLSKPAAHCCELRKGWFGTGWICVHLWLFGSIAIEAEVHPLNVRTYRAVIDVKLVHAKYQEKHNISKSIFRKSKYWLLADKPNARKHSVDATMDNMYTPSKYAYSDVNKNRWFPGNFTVFLGIPYNWPKLRMKMYNGPASS